MSGRVHAANPPVSCVGNEEISAAVDGQATRTVYLGGGGGTTVSSEAPAIARKCGYYLCDSVHTANSLVVPVRDEKVSHVVDCDSIGKGQQSGRGRTTVSAQATAGEAIGTGRAS